MNDFQILLYFHHSYDFNYTKVQESTQIQSWSSSREETIGRNPHLLGCHRGIQLFREFYILFPSICSNIPFYCGISSIVEALEKDCIVMNKGATPHASTIRYTVRKGHTGSANGTIPRNGRTRKPITTPARSASAQSSGAAGFPSRTIVIITLCTLQHLFLALVSNPRCL